MNKVNKKNCEPVIWELNSHHALFGENRTHVRFVHPMLCCEKRGFVFSLPANSGEETYIIIVDFNEIKIL